MHRALFCKREDLVLYVKHFENILDRASIKNKHEYHLSNEDFYIYFTTHSYKHFNNSGCGLRTLVDYYLYLKNNKNLDFEYIDKELDKIGLKEFSNMISSLSMKIFDNEELNEEEKDTLLFIASSGTYGTLRHSVDKGVKEKGKFGYLMSRLFPPMSYYKMAHPWAYKTKVLIPIAWIMRFFRILFTNPKKATNEIKMINKTKK